jgi:hypothetical protein
MKYCKTRKAWVPEEEKPPCGKNKECAGAAQGFRCGAHGGVVKRNDQQEVDFERMLSENARAYFLERASRGRY